MRLVREGGKNGIGVANYVLNAVGSICDCTKEIIRDGQWGKCVLACGRDTQKKKCDDHMKHAKGCL